MATKNPAHRNKIIKIRLFDDEYQKIADKSVGSLASWCRATLLELDTPAPPKADPALLRELGKIGGNLNQIAHAVNYDAKIGTIDKIRLNAQLTEIRQLMQDLLNDY